MKLIYSDAIRYYQAAKMFDKHKMFPLHPFKDDLSKSFENQILATCVSKAKYNIVAHILIVPQTQLCT